MKKIVILFSAITILLCLSMENFEKSIYITEAEVLGVYCDNTAYAESPNGEVFSFSKYGVEQGDIVRLTLCNFSTEDITDDKVLFVEVFAM